MVRMVLLPGLDGTGELFSGFIEALPSGFEGVAVRYPQELHLSYAELDACIQAARPAEGQFILVAESFSTPLAIKYAATHPENLAGIVLCAGFAQSPIHGLSRLLVFHFAPAIFRLPLPNPIVRLFLPGSGSPTDLVDTTKRIISSVKPGVLIARLRAVLTCDVRAELDRIAVPILYMQAKQDRLVSARCLQVIQRHKSKLNAVAMDGPHLLLQRHPREAVEAIVAFVDRTLDQTVKVEGGANF